MSWHVDFNEDSDSAQSCKFDETGHVLLRVRVVLRKSPLFRQRRKRFEDKRPALVICHVHMQDIKFGVPGLGDN